MSIHQAVQNGILKKEPKLLDIVNPFSTDFEISWGSRRTAYNTTIYEFIIKPSQTVAETFGLEYDLLLVYSPYPEMQPRVMQAVSSLFSDDPAKGRVENFLCVLVSDDPNAKEWVNKYTIQQQDLRSYVVFHTDILKTKQRYSTQTAFREQLRERDLFDVQLPLVDDLYFFGRQAILRDIHDNIRRCENCGLFGLRKTGKTSLLFKVKRTVSELNLGKTLFYDAKNAKIRMRSWIDLLIVIIRDICEMYNLQIDFPESGNPINVVETFENTIKAISTQEKLILIFDEIEYISFEPLYDFHWKEDFFHFWQLLWTMQSEYRNFCFIIAGVNPTVVETSSISKIQNPLFSIVKKYYVRGLEREDIHNLARRIGRRMGMHFDKTAVDYLFQRYGGHPLLTRLALSYENRSAAHKPINLTEDLLRSTQESREEELIAYCQHIIDVLSDFYPDEYILLQYLSVDDIQDFLDLATSPLSVTHLKNYGLLKYEEGVPQIGIPVVSNYIRQGVKNEQKTEFARMIIQPNERATWVFNMTRSIMDYMRQLEVAIRKDNTSPLFGSNSFPEAEKLLDVPVAHNESQFKAFMSTFSNCFVESIENYGKSISKSQYFWNEIKTEYPHLFRALLRVKVYRNWVEHLSLNSSMQKLLDEFLSTDLEDKNFYDIEDGYFVLQQCTLEKLKLSISLEITRLS